MKRFALVLVLLPLAACGGTEDNRWLLTFLDPAGRPTTVPKATVVLFEEGAAPRIVYRDLGGFPYRDDVHLPALGQGHYEVWLPGYRPLRVDRKPSGRLQLELGFPVDVEWRAGVPFAEGARIHVQATWRGPGDHPEALLRASVAAAAPLPGSHTPSWIEFVKGILIDPATRTGRLYVPWPGPYRVTWGEGRYAIREGPGSFSGSGGGSRSPGDGTTVVVPAEGAVARVLLPRP